MIFSLLNVLSIITLLLSALLGAYVYLSDRREKVNTIFLAIIVSNMVWVTSNLFVDVATTVRVMEFWSKVAIVGPLFIVYFLFKLSVIFPNTKPINKFQNFLSTGFLLVLLVLVPTKFNLTSVELDTNGTFTINPGLLYSLLAVYFIFLLTFTFKNLFSNFESLNQIERLRVWYVATGVATSIILGSLTNMILPLLGISQFANFGPYFILIFILFTAYAIIRFRLFGVKVISTQLFVVSLCIFTLVEALIAESLPQRVLNGIFFFLSVFFGVLLVRSVQQEIENREKGERLARYLANANARLRELDKQKTEFVSIASHQLRSPIAAIKGYASLISDGSYGSVPDTLKEPLRRILESGQRIGIMVDDFLNITRIEQGRMTYNMVSQNVCKLLQTVINELKVVAEEKGLELTMVCNNEKEYLVNADEGKLKQIFSNLIDNAIKYTQEGSIEVTVSTLDPEHKVLVQVKDTGIGIAPDETSNLFQKFNRASNANEVNVLGTGLGLYIAREIMKAHEGWINVESEGVGKGSTFTVELPVCDECVKQVAQEKTSQ